MSSSPVPTLTELREAFQVRPVDGVVTMAGYDPSATPFVEGKKQAKRAVEQEFPDRLFDAHELLFAECDRNALLVLQGVDSSGKNGTIKHVVIHMNPAGVRVASFGEPTEEELEHHFLWRYRRDLPKSGQLGVFDRSHYEDLLVPTVYETLSGDEIAKCTDEVNEWEAELVESGTTIVKCMLHISFEEQRERFLRRLRREDKRWKFAMSDLEARRHWDEFQTAYGTVLAATSTEHAPWFVIPSDHKWYRNWAVAALLLQTFDSMGLAYPQPGLDYESLRTQLQPPN